MRWWSVSTARVRNPPAHSVETRSRFGPRAFAKRTSPIVTAAVERSSGIVDLGGRQRAQYSTWAVYGRCNTPAVPLNAARIGYCFLQFRESNERSGWGNTHDTARAPHPSRVKVFRSERERATVIVVAGTTQEAISMVRRDVISCSSLVLFAVSGIAQYDNCTSGFDILIGDALCASQNNNLGCGYDGGDCCECTCVDAPERQCGPFFPDCLDPSCVDPLVAEYPNCTGDIFLISNGQCETENNNPGCGYDGGDCCECTCMDGAFFVCPDSFYICEDPACLDSGVDAAYPNCTENLFWIGDGLCDKDTHNNPDCGYDGGDCCGCTCVDGIDYFCSPYLSDCADPTCVYPLMVAYPNCTGDIFSIGNGLCNPENNNPSCGYDEGDCCLCTCVDGDRDCLFVGFDCIDPDAGDELYGCNGPPPAAVPCSATSQRPWVVQDTAGAQALAEAVNCSGGFFEVEWRGDIVLRTPIHVAGGTVLNVTGVSSFSSIDGNSSTRLFTVVNASLHVSNLTISHGASMAGGAIAAIGSTLTFNGTSFIDNVADGYGGALFVSSHSSVSCVGAQDFSGNSALGDGGAIYVSATSTLSWSGETSFFNNTAGVHGGAVMVVDGSIASWEGETTFSGNTGGDAGIRAAGSGGALYVVSNSTVSWSGGTIFSGNTAPSGGGAVVRDSSRISWDQKTLFAGNIADGYAGALFVFADSSVSWRGETTFAGNVAFNDGGALAIDTNCSVSWGGNTTFTGNAAEGDGGALYALNGARVLSSGEAVFAANSAGGFGGAIALSESSVWWNGEVFFVDNFANFGGVFHVVANSNVSFMGEAATFSGNSAVFGGGVSVMESSIWWSGKVEFTDNLAINAGGVYAFANSSVSFDGETTFDGNSAAVNEDGVGGALLVFDSSVLFGGQVWFRNNWGGGGGGAIAAQTSNISFSGDTSFFNNSADAGGALFITTSSSCEWQGNAEFVNNSADVGGAVAVSTNASVLWSGETSFAGNSANESGGAISALDSSWVSWSADTMFIHNSAHSDGGAVDVRRQSGVWWSADTLFFGNTADSAGAVYISDGSAVGWSGRTEFISNVAHVFNGGAVGSFATDPIFNQQDSVLVINGSTDFVNNTCGANGGGLALLGALSLSFGTTDVTFRGNSADVAGGAVFISRASRGPVFPEISFIANTAQVGGAVYVTGSGATTISVDGVQVQNPTTFVGCRFVGNEATTTGGAVESAAGQDLIFSTVFMGNTARVGGALRLAGTADLNNCSFIENISEEGGGAAISNIGYLRQILVSSFVGNTFDCKPGEFLDYDPSGNIFDAVCDGCYATCVGCSFEEPGMVPTCSDVMEHSTSPGGTVTLEELQIESGYWRATTTSREVLTCYNAEACVGGVTASSDYCDQGYEGPYCSICSDGYTENMGFSCGKCSDTAGGIALAAVLAAIALVAVVFLVSYIVSGKLEGARRGFVNRIRQYVPFQSIKIVIVSWQILTQFASVANVTYPDVYQRFLDGVDVLNFDLSWILSAGCIVEVDFHDRVLISTIGPILAATFLGATYAVGVNKTRGSEDGLHTVRHKHVSMMLLLTFLVYSSVSSVLFQMFACEKLEDGRNYLRADYRIECDSSRHKALQIYAGFMIALYTVGIPAWYAGLLFLNREMLKDVTGRNDNVRVSWTADLWKPYKPDRFYYEVIECARRILLAGVVVFIYPNTAAQIAVTLMLAFVFFGIAEAMSPYVSRWDCWVSRAGHVIVYVSMYVALLLKVDVSGERASSQRVFEAILVSAHACMIVAVLGEAVVIACSLARDQVEISTPRFRGIRNFKWYKGAWKSPHEPPRDDFRPPPYSEPCAGERKER